MHFFLARSALDVCLEEDGVGGGRVEMIDPMHKQDGKVYALARRVAASIREGAVASRLEVESIGLSLAAHLLRAHSSIRGSRLFARASTGGLAPYQLRRALDRMSDLLADDPSLAELAAVVGLSTKHFARAFRQSTGLAPHQWMIHHRVMHAQAMLVDPAAQLSDIALACGFADQSHFTAAFRKMFGVTPGRYRRERQL